MEKTGSPSIIKIAVLGAESTGKSTLCEDLAKHYQTVYVPEYARIYFNHHDINQYTLDDLELIAKQQLILEQQQYLVAKRFLFCDTSLITIKIWAQHRFNKNSKLISNLIKPTDYDLYFICNNDVVWIKDEQRKDPDLREHIFKLNKHELSKINASYHVIKGIGNQKLKQAIELIDDFYNRAL